MLDNQGIDDSVVRFMQPQVIAGLRQNYNKQIFDPINCCEIPLCLTISIRLVHIKVPAGVSLATVSLCGLSVITWVGWMKRSYHLIPPQGSCIF